MLSQEIPELKPKLQSCLLSCFSKIPSRKIVPVSLTNHDTESFQNKDVLSHSSLEESDNLCLYNNKSPEASLFYNGLLQSPVVPLAQSIRKPSY